MKKSLYAALTLVGVLALSASAQPAHDETGGVDRSGHEHSQPAKNPADETEVDRFWRLSDEAFHLGDYPRAISFHKSIVILDPHDTESYGIAAWLMWSLGQKDEALAHIERGLKANPTNPEMWNFAGEQYDLQKKEMPALAIKAKEAYANAIRFLPADTSKEDAQLLRRRLAHAAEKAGDLKLSLATWRMLVADFPEDAVNKNNLARVEKLSLEQKKSAAAPVIIGGVGVATIALLGGSFRGRKLRVNRASKIQSPSVA